MPTPQKPLYRLIPLTQGQWAIVDAADYGWLMQWKWQAQWSAGSHSFYAMRRALGGERAGRPTIMMHREILNLSLEDEREGDHKNHDTLDNRLLNLRIASGDDNKRNQRRRSDNTTGHKGVSTDRYSYTARIQVNGTRIYLGSFPKTPAGLKAASGVCQFAADLYFGEFAFLENHQVERLNIGHLHNQKTNLNFGKPRPQCVRGDSKTGCKGVTIFKNKQYRVDVAVGGKRMYFGLYPLTEEGFQKAKAVRQLAEELYWEHPE
jgi:hypothetical protein